MGTLIVRKKKDGKKSYLARVRLRGGKHLCQTFATKTRAQEWMLTTEAAVKEGRINFIQETKKYTVSEMIERYIKMELPKKPKSRQSQTMQLNWWKNQIGHYPLVKVSPAILVECRDKLAVEIIRCGGQRSPSTINRYLAAIAHSFTVASKEWLWIDDSPMKLVSRLKESRGRDHILSLDEIKILLCECKMNRNRALFPIVFLALATGMRRGEILSLKWKDVDLSRSKIILRKTKNNEIRSVHIAPDVIDALEVLYRERRKDTDFLFPSIDGKSPANIRTAWDFLMKRLGFEDFRFHDLRHTAASHMAMAGSSDSELRAFLGHKSASMVIRYAHYRESAMESSVNRLGEKIKKAIGE